MKENKLFLKIEITYLMEVIGKEYSSYFYVPQRIKYIFDDFKKQFIFQDLEYVMCCYVMEGRLGVSFDVISWVWVSMKDHSKY